jgi:uncharacterized phiE125 gp8 family phage protein
MITETMMIPMLIDGPTIEPVSLAEAKAWLKVDGSDEDDLIRSLIVAARLMVEAEIGQVLIGQTWRLIGDTWPSAEEIPVRVGRIIAVPGGRVFDAASMAQAISLDAIRIRRGSMPHAVIVTPRPAPGRPRAGIEIDLRLGFGEAAADVPETIRLAIRRLVALWHADRGEGEPAEAGLPPQIRVLLKPFRAPRLT